MPTPRSYAASFKRLASCRRIPTFVDVSKLVGYIDEDHDAQQRTRREKTNGNAADGIVERSFLKARSMRFTMRGNKARDA